MSSSETITIDLRKAADAPIDLQQTLDDSYFTALDQDEILGGTVEVSIHVKAAAAESFRITAKIKGTVSVICDRCLDEVILPVETEQQMTLRYGDQADEQDDAYDVVVIPFTANTYDMSWDVYEFIELALPLQRSHPDGECNEDITQYILTSDEEE